MHGTQQPRSSHVRHQERRLRRQSGVTLIELGVFMAVVVPVMAALAATVDIFSSAATSSHHRTTAVGQNQRILQRIVAELSMTTTNRDHGNVGNPPTPHPPGAGGANSAYNMLLNGNTPAVEALHDTQSRDGLEYWHTVWEQRRLYIYATYRPFDTIEYQKVRTPTDMSHVDQTTGSVVQPWSARRKIFLEDGSVLLRVDAPGGPRTVVLGTDVTDLRFHLNVDGHVIIRLSTTSGPAGGQRDVTITSQVTVNPRNGLS